MRFVLACAAVAATAALFTAPAFAQTQELVASNGGDSVRLSDKPCTSEKVLSQLKPNFHAMMRSASASVSGQSFQACWVVDGDSAHLLYEDGDQGLIPLTDFKKPTSV